MQKSFIRSMMAAVSVLISLSVSPTARAQGVTTASISGFVLEKDGTPIGGAAIAVVHEPTGTRAAATTRANGQFDLSGLRVGGPYSITADAPDHRGETRSWVYLDLGSAQTVTFRLESETIVMEAFKVEAQRDLTFGSGMMSSGTTMNAREIADTPTVRRDVQDLAALDSRISISENTSLLEYAVSAQGQNNRFNSFLIDGVQANDPFGLNANGFSSLRSPVPFSAIESFSLSLSPYDVKYTGFTGALINAVIKSGTNDFHGSVYGYYTGKRLRGPNPVTGDHDQLQERTQGASFGGPILKNRLFFYLHWENFRRVQAAPGQVFGPAAAVAEQLAATAKDVYGYDVGSIGAGASLSEQTTYISKIDWNISERHRATVAYRRTESTTPNFSDFNGSTYTSFSNHWYQARRINDVYSATLNSSWSSNFRTDAGAQYSRYDGTASPNGEPFPEVYVNGVSGTRLTDGMAITGQVAVGTNYSYQLNGLLTKNYNGHLYGEYSVGDHTLKFGGDVDRTKYDDKFVQYYYGRYVFASPLAFAAGTPNYLRYQQAIPGYDLDQAFAKYSMTDYGLLLQDTWKPTPELLVVAGLRYDYPLFPDRPPANPAFETAFGFPNTAVATGNSTLAPRLGVNLNIPESFLRRVLGGRKTQVRGGIGLFQGTNPAVWIANSYQNAGVLNAVQYGTSTTSITNPPITQVPLPVTLDPGYVQSLPPPGVPTPVINVTDPGFRPPTSWKANIAIDHTLPWYGLIASGEINLLEVERGAAYESLNLNPVGTLPDGRIRYSGNKHPNFSTVLKLKNTREGAAQAYTLALRRPMKDNWSASASYTHTHATEVTPFTSSVATSNFNYRSVINPNEEIARSSAYNTPDKLVITLTRQFHLVHRDNAGTRVSATYRLQTGHAYSWVFGNNVNGDDYSGFNDAFYMPGGADDPKVSWSSTAQRDAFFAFAQGTDLKKHKGMIVPPNSSYNPEQQTVDLHIEQEVPLFRSTKLTLFVDCLNFANLFNDRWGAVAGLDFGTGSNGYNRITGVTAAYDALSNRYVYSFDPAKVSDQPPFTDQSRWQVQLGARFDF